MSQEDNFDNEQSPDHWSSRFEDECLVELEAQNVIESTRAQSSEEQTAQQMWLGFQQTSTAIAQLYNYKDSACDGYVLLVPFNKAAESLTKFYKDSLNNARECLRLGVQNGRNNRTREIAAWVRKKRKNIRRDELLAYLCGKNAPPHHRNRQNRSSLERQIPRLSPHHQTDSLDSGDYPVRDSFSLQGLNGAMSSINMGYNRSSATASSTTTQQEFRFHDDRARCENRKRNNSSSAMDECMESPSRKRGRFL